MFQAQKDVKAFMDAAGLHIGDASAGYSEEQRQQIDQIISGLSECFNTLADAVNTDNNFIGMCEAMCATHWQMLILGHALGVPINECWQEYRRSLMQCINPKTGKLYTPDDTPNVHPCDIRAVLARYYGEE